MCKSGWLQRREELTSTSQHKHPITLLKVIINTLRYPLVPGTVSPRVVLGDNGNMD